MKGRTLSSKRKAFYTKHQYRLSRSSPAYGKDEAFLGMSLNPEPLDRDRFMSVQSLDAEKPVYLGQI